MKFAYFVIGFGVVNIEVGLLGWPHYAGLLFAGLSLIITGWSRRNTLHSPYRRHPSLLDLPRD